jgi:hypothetical protein
MRIAEQEFIILMKTLLWLGEAMGYKVSFRQGCVGAKKMMGVQRFTTGNILAGEQSAIEPNRVRYSAGLVTRRLFLIWQIYWFCLLV